MTVYALDTNIVTLLLKNDETVIDNASNATNDGHELVIPPIVDYEVRRGLLAKGMDKKLREYLVFRQSVSTGVINEAVWLKAADIYAKLNQSGKNIDDADILIASFCIVNDYTLVTNNTRHFSWIDGLVITDWKLDQNRPADNTKNNAKDFSDT